MTVIVAKRLVVTRSPYESRAALLEDGVVVELFIERSRARGIVGNIYKGRVRKVLPGMQSAFVDVGLEKDAFLYVSDVAEEEAEDKWSLGDGDDNSDGSEEVAPTSTASIEDLLAEGQLVVVQVAKEPIAGKGARVTTHVTLPGRYVVYMPTVRHVGVSRRIESEAERARLKDTVNQLRDRFGAGFIVRTAGEGRSAGELEADASFLRGVWEPLRERIDQVGAPALIHEEMDLLGKLLRDLVAGEFGEVVVDTRADYDRCTSFLERAQSELVGRVVLHLDPTPVFEAYGIEAEIERALQSKVWLRNGGYIVINQTEALVAIDVNTGRYVGKVRLEDTVLKTNLEAVKEIVRQVRLRDLGGIIVVDFIDMEEAEHRARVVEELERELRRDRSKTKILQISDFGLVEMTRKRVKGSLERLLTRPCAACGGSGRVKSAETVCYGILRELAKARRSLASDLVELTVHPDVATLLTASDRQLLADAERDLGLKVDLRTDLRLRIDQYDLMGS